MALCQNRLPTTHQLRGAPELAAYATLGAATASAKRLLLATHPELHEMEDLHERPHVPAHIWNAARLLDELDALSNALGQYAQDFARGRPANRPLDRP